MVRRIPTKKTAHKMIIWDSYREPVGHKFYGSAKKDRVWEHFEFSVVTPRSMNRRVMYFWVKQTIGRMIRDKELPPRHYYDTYRGFLPLMAMDWERGFERVVYDYKHTAT